MSAADPSAFPRRANRDAPPPSPGGPPCARRSGPALVHRSGTESAPVSFLRAGRDAMLSTQSGKAKVMPKNDAIHARRSVREIRRARADQSAADLAPVIAELRASGVTSLHGIAAALNERGIPTVAGPGRWYHTQVRRLLARLAAA
jgi:hypothetical protein